MTDNRATTSPTADAYATAGARPRSLNQPVLSSAEEELDMDTPTHDTGSSYTGTAGAGGQVEGSGANVRPAWWLRVEDQLARYVNEQPAKAALMALGAGAVAALLLGRGRRGKRGRN